MLCHTDPAAPAEAGLSNVCCRSVMVCSFVV
jgi:hypothetical protein